MIASGAVLLLLAATAAGVGLLSRALSRRIPAGFLVLFLVLSLSPFPRAHLPGKTVLPLEHVALTAPWLSLGSGPPWNPYTNDVVMQMLPWSKAVRAAYEERTLPLRDRWNGCGTPLAANGQSAAFSPFTLFTLPLPLFAAYLLAAEAKLLLAMAGMFLWIRELSVSARASVFASIAFALSPCFSQWILLPHTAVLCFWPWMLFLLERCRDVRGRRRAVAALTAVLVAAALAGHPETLALGLLFSALWFVLRWTVRDLPDWGIVLRCGIVAGALAVGLAAFLLLPTALAIRSSNRMALAARPHWSGAFSLLPHGAFWRGIATAFFPRSLGDLIHAPQISGVTGAFPEMDLGYFGIVGWAAALLVLRPGSRRARASWVLLGLLVCGLGVAVALWPFAEIFGAIPVVRHIFPLRFSLWTAFAGPALAALELDRCARDLERRPRAALSAIAVPILLAAAAVLWYLHLRPELTAPGADGFQRRQLAVAVGLLGAFALLVLLTRRRAGVLVVGLAALCAADLLYQWHGHYRFFPTSLFYPDEPLLKFLRAQPGPFRVLGASTALFPNTNVFAGVEDIRTHDPLERRDYVAFLDETAGYPPGDYFKKVRNVNAPVLDFLNVRYLVQTPGEGWPGGHWRAVYSGADGNVFENPRVLPRAFVPGRVRFVAHPALREPLLDANAAFGAALSSIAQNEDWRGTAWVLSDREAEEAGGESEITQYREETNAVFFDARVGAGGAWIVLSLVQDGGWSARTDGAPAPLRRANGPFLALHMDEGAHRVVLRYRPPGFLPGLWISVSALVLVLGLAAARRSR